MNRLWTFFGIGLVAGFALGLALGVLGMMFAFLSFIDAFMTVWG